MSQSPSSLLRTWRLAALLFRLVKLEGKQKRLALVLQMGYIVVKRCWERGRWLGYVAVEVKERVLGRWEVAWLLSYRSERDGVGRRCQQFC